MEACHDSARSGVYDRLNLSADAQGNFMSEVNGNPAYFTCIRILRGYDRRDSKRNANPAGRYEVLNPRIA